MRIVLIVAVLGLGASAAPARAQDPDSETPGGRQAREQARLCEREQGETGLVACRAALDLGLPPVRRAAVRDLLARHLVELERWVELVDHYREGVRLDPGNAEAWFRLGTTLLFTVDDAVEASAALGEAVRLDPSRARSRVALALALVALGRSGEATVQFDEALRIDPEALEGQPAARAARDAALRGRSWP